MLTTKWRVGARAPEKSIHRPAPSGTLIDLLPTNDALVSPSVSFDGSTFFSVNPTFALPSTTVIVYRPAFSEVDETGLPPRAEAQLPGRADGRRERPAVRQRLRADDVRVVHVRSGLPGR